MNPFNPQNYSQSGKQPDNSSMAKPPMPFNPQNLSGLGNNSFGPSLPSLVANPLGNTFASAGLQGEHIGYPYMQDMAYQEHMKKLREKFVEMREQIDKMEKNPELFKTHQLPLARVKKIMKSDEDVRMISAEAPVLFAKACEIFIIELTHRAWFHTEEGKRRTLQKNDIAQCIANTDIFDFLIDIIPREEYTKNAILKKPADSYMAGFNQYANSASMLSNLPLPSNLNYSLPSSMGMNINPNLLSNSNMFPNMGNFKNPLVFPGAKGNSPNSVLNPNLLNYQNLMNSGQYSMPSFDMGQQQQQGGSHQQGMGQQKGGQVSKKEADGEYM